jgi:signal transduction histidine kinase/CheY-like chemotaxis protein
MDANRQHFEILNKLQTGVVVHAPDTQIIFSNLRASELLGLSEDQLRGKTAIDPEWHFVDESGRALSPSEYPVSRVIASGESLQNLVLGVNRSNKTQREWLLVSAFPELDASGALQQVVVNFYDITQRKIAEEKHKANEMFTKSVLDSLSAQIAVLDRDGNIIEVNEAWRQFAICNGASAELAASVGVSYFTGCGSMAAVTPDSEGFESFDGIRAVLRGDLAEFNVEYPCDSPTEQRWFRMNVTPLLRVEGGVVVSHVNITERKRAEQLLRGAIDTIDEAFVLYDPDDRLVYCNEKYRKVYKKAADLMVPGVHFEELIRKGAERGEYSAAVGRIDEWVAERMATHRLGNTTLVQKLESGQTLRIIERKMASGHTVGFRIDITELVTATEAAQEASRSKGLFLANMSHEIRTPMNAVLGMLQLLQKTELTRQQRDYASKSDSAARSLLVLINDILDFSKVEAGKMTLEAQPFRLESLLENLSTVVSTNVGSKPVEVLFDIDREVPPALVGDAFRLQQILVNLCSNALKFTSQGQVVFSIRAHPGVMDVPAGAAVLDFAVTDSGIGIAPEHQAHIFTGFSQAEASTTRRFGGTGLGLAICKRLVQAMGGDLQLTSTLGVGSTFAFTLSLPLAPEPVASDAALNQTAHSRKVLIVDDNTIAQNLMHDMVHTWGWHADLADSGEQAVAIVQAQLEGSASTVDVVYLDWHMPGLDGWDTAHQIQGLCQEAGATVPKFVMITAHGRDMLSHRTQHEQAMLNGFLTKPFTASMVFEAAQDANDGATALRRNERTASSQRRLSGLHILVVEDNLINQQVAEELLITEGARVSLAANGQLGVNAVVAAKPQFDLVLMDVQMPVLDGYGATKVIREQIGLLHLPIIAMTANAMASDREECLAAGMNEHVGKPFDLTQLVNTIIRLTGHRAESVPSQVCLTAKSHSEVDAASALKRLGGNVAIYLRAARDFSAQLPNTARAFIACLGAGGLAGASEQMHTLKGTSSTLGAIHLSLEAERLEAMCKSAGDVALIAAQADTLDALANSAKRALDVVISELEANALGNTMDAKAGGAADVEDGTAVLSQLLLLLHDGDMAVLELFAGARHRLTAFNPAQLDSLENALQNLDFETAAQACVALRRPTSL